MRKKRKNEAYIDCVNDDINTTTANDKSLKQVDKEKNKQLKNF